MPCCLAASRGWVAIWDPRQRGKEKRRRKEEKRRREEESTGIVHSSGVRLN